MWSIDVRILSDRTHLKTKRALKSTHQENRLAKVHSQALRHHENSDPINRQQPPPPPYEKTSLREAFPRGSSILWRGEFATLPPLLYSQFPQVEALLLGSHSFLNWFNKPDGPPIPKPCPVIGFWLPHRRLEESPVTREPESPISSIAFPRQPLLSTCHPPAGIRSIFHGPSSSSRQLPVLCAAFPSPEENAYINQTTMRVAKKPLSLCFSLFPLPTQHRHSPFSSRVWVSYRVLSRPIHSSGMHSCRHLFWCFFLL